MGSKAKRSQEAGASLTKGKDSIKRYFYARKWDTSYRGYTLNQDEINYRLENNLPIDDLYDILDKKYKHKKCQNGN